MPAHALVAVVIEIEQASVERPARDLFNGILDAQKLRRPCLGLFFHTGVRVTASLIPNPGHLSLGGDQLPKHAQLVDMPV